MSFHCSTLQLVRPVSFFQYLQLEGLQYHVIKLMMAFNEHILVSRVILLHIVNKVEHGGQLT